MRLGRRQPMLWRPFTKRVRNVASSDTAVWPAVLSDELDGPTVSLTGADVVVVGAGIAGTTTALLMARAGASVTLLERSAVPDEARAGVLLQPNGLAVLAGLGLDHRLRTAGCVLHRATIYGSGSRPIADSSITDFGCGLDHVLAVRGSALQEVLLDAVADEPAIACRFGAAATRCSAEGAVELHWHGRWSTIQARLVVGADGVRSAVRSGGNFGTRVRYAGRSYVRGLVPRNGTFLDGAYWTSLGLFGIARVDADTVYFNAAAHTPAVAAAIAAGDLNALTRLWGAVLPLAGCVMGRLGAASDLLHDDVVRIDCPVWHDGSAVLVGDAAHAMASTVGQGANSALVDAAVLVAELARDAPQAQALRRYADRRRSAVGAVQARADMVSRLSGLRPAPVRAARDLATRVAFSTRGAAARSLRTLQQEDPATLLATVTALCR
jgi:2-polyprenyl-6-methoxyphenol hydroxylase-like FAD-dependent oxidoreductase